jgi:rare lipoprotein A (peptidoglycan hydrolase)
MTHQKANQYDASSNFAMSLQKCLSGLSQLTLIAALASSGCEFKEPNEPKEQSKSTPQNQDSKPLHKEVGEASWYGPGFHGKETANGETFDQKDLTAAHPTLPMGTTAKVTNLENGKKVDVRINDRGPFTENRVIDVSKAAATKLDMQEDGTTQVKIETKHIKKKVTTKRSSKKKKHAKKIRTAK